MCITKCGDWGLTEDSRFKSWGKVLRGPAEVDLSQKDGYSLRGRFVRWNESIALGDGEYLVIAAETGSRNNHAYKYRLVAGGSTPRRIEKEEREAVIEAGRAAGVAEEQIARAKNSTLYAYALYVSLRAQGIAAPVPVDPVAAARSRVAAAEAELEAARKALAEAEAAL
jgi:hypothetical protein